MRSRFSPIEETLPNVFLPSSQRQRLSREGTSFVRSSISRRYNFGCVIPDNGPRRPVAPERSAYAANPLRQIFRIRLKRRKGRETTIIYEAIRSHALQPGITSLRLLSRALPRGFNEVQKTETHRRE